MRLRDAVKTARRTIRQLLRDPAHAYTPSERKVVRTLLGDYPAAGLGTAASLAGRAGVSDPTVMRLVQKLGFSHFAQFQQAVLAEVSERMSSPLTLLATRRKALAQDDLYGAFLETAARGLAEARELVSLPEWDRAVQLAADPRHRLHCLGGRFSRFLAGYLWWHLRQLRRDCTWLDGSSAVLIDTLVDLGTRDVVIVFDYRRYQRDVIAYAKGAVATGAHVVLFTDRSGSPIAPEADAVIAAPVETISPFDSLVPALAQTEAFVAAVTAAAGNKARIRLSRLETLRTEMAAVDQPEQET
jgi:DNA-binding MurR/RpiR family transcriptional regulator